MEYQALHPTRSSTFKIIRNIVIVVVIIGIIVWMSKLHWFSDVSKRYDYANDVNSLNPLETFGEVCIQPEDAAQMLQYALNSLGWIDLFIRDYTSVLNNAFSAYISPNSIQLKNPGGGQAFTINEASISIKNCVISANATTYVYVPLLMLPFNQSSITVQNMYFNISSTTSVISTSESTSAITNKIEKIQIDEGSASTIYAPQINAILDSVVKQYLSAPIQLVSLKLPSHQVCAQICDLISESGFVCC
jgi:hypothetical protein